MPNTTPNLGLFKYDLSTDGKSPFSITDSLNNNWDILDDKIANLDALPSQEGNENKFLTTNGTEASWANVDALPDQTGNADKILTTNGTNASWREVSEAYPVIEKYSNGSHWYRVYSDNWCEQGGFCISGTAITLLKTYINTDYFLSTPFSAKSMSGFTPSQTTIYLTCGYIA